MPSKPQTHKPARASLPDGRPSAAARGYGAHWRRVRAAVLAERPVCEECNRVAAVDVDHVVSLRKGGTNDPSNLRALCHSCHSRKTVERDQGFGHRRG